MNWDTFSYWGQHISKWAADYHRTLAERPVRAQTAPGEIAAQLVATPPETGEPMDAIMADFERIVMPGITHWQHPRFFAYFPANAAFRSAKNCLTSSETKNVSSGNPSPFRAESANFAPTFVHACFRQDRLTGVGDVVALSIVAVDPERGECGAAVD